MNYLAWADEWEKIAYGEAQHTQLMQPTLKGMGVAGGVWGVGHQGEFSHRYGHQASVASD